MSLTKIRLPLWELPNAILVQIFTWLLNVLVTFRWCDFVFPAFLVAVDARWGWGGGDVRSSTGLVIHVPPVLVGRYFAIYLTLAVLGGLVWGGSSLGCPRGAPPLLLVLCGVSFLSFLTGLMFPYILCCFHVIALLLWTPCSSRGGGGGHSWGCCLYAVLLPPILWSRAYRPLRS